MSDCTEHVDCTIQSDGRHVVGPQLRPAKKQGSAGLFGLVVGACAFFLLLGVYVGTQVAPQPSWQELYGERLLQGCLPQVLVVGVGKQGETDKLNDGATYAASGIRATFADARDIDVHVVSVPETAGLREKNPDAQIVAYVTVERCLGGGGV